MGLQFLCSLWLKASYGNCKKGFKIRLAYDLVESLKKVEIFEFFGQKSADGLNKNMLRGFLQYTLALASLRWVR